MSKTQFALILPEPISTMGEELASMKLNRFPSRLDQPRFMKTRTFPTSSSTLGVEEPKTPSVFPGAENSSRAIPIVTPDDVALVPTPATDDKVMRSPL